MNEHILFRDVEVDAHVVDVRVEGRQVTEIAEHLGERGARVVDGGGGALLPGLHDHHVHLLAMAAAARSVRVGPPEVPDRATFRSALRAAADPRSSGSWIRAVGYHERVAGDLDRWTLDALVPHRPLRVQHRSGASWILNSRALDDTGAGAAGSLPGLERGADGVPTGRLFGLDRWLRERVPSEPLDLAALGRRLLAFGVTGVTDATPSESPADFDVLAHAVAAGDLPQHVAVTGSPHLDAASAPLGAGPAKIVVADHDLPQLPALVHHMRAARRHGRAVAVHCVSGVALALTIAAFDEVGVVPGDRIEHGAVVPLDVAHRLADDGITVVTQPNFVGERGDEYLDEVDAADAPDLWRCASLLDAGVAVGAGTDAPFGDPDPWRAIAAATTRLTAAGRVLGADERLAPGRALELFLSPLDAPGGPPRRLRVGVRADLCLLAVPLRAALEAPSTENVVLTLTSREPQSF